MRAVMQLIDRAAFSDTPVLLVGKRDGKVSLERCTRSREPPAFLAVNCSAISRHSSKASSSVTGAVRSLDAVTTRWGCFNLPGGTVFLDEIGDMAPPLRASSCVCCRRRRSSRSVLPPVPTDGARRGNAPDRLLWRKGGFAKIQRTASTSSRCRPPARGGPTTWTLSALWTSTDRRSAGVITVSDVMAVLRRHSWPGNAKLRM